MAWLEMRPKVTGWDLRSRLRTSIRLCGSKNHAEQLDSKARLDIFGDAVNIDLHW